MTWRVIVGTLSLMITMIALGFVAVTEQDRMASFTTAYQSRQIEYGGALFENYCATCHGLEGQGSSRAPALNAIDLFDGERLKKIGWAGTPADFVRATIASGRPRISESFNANSYPQRMPTWSSDFGGPLRKDQIDALVAFVMNWGPAYANITPEPTPTIVPVGTDINAKLPTGNAVNGKALTEKVGCVACHTGQTLIGPAWLAAQSTDNKGVGAHAADRYQDASYTGKAISPEQYLHESIVQPSAFIVPGGDYKNADGTSKMPAIYGNTLDAQNLADIIAYLLTLK
jgi:mono/diheme cytochrome c family protein